MSFSWGAALHDRTLFRTLVRKACVFLRAGVIRSCFRWPYFLRCWLRKSTPSVMWVMEVFSFESSRPLCFHHRPDLVFEELFRVSRNHEVIGESNHVDPVSRKQRFQCPFEPVQGHVAERRRDDPALGVPAWVGKRRRRSMTPDFSHCASILLSSGT